MIKPFGKHKTSVRARRNNDVSSNTQKTSRAVVRYRTRQKKRLFTVVTIVVASVMVPIMIASAANGNMGVTPAEPAAQVQQAEASPSPEPTETPAFTEKTQSAQPSQDTSSVTAVGETAGAQEQAPAPSAEAAPVETAPVYTTLTEGMTDASVPALQQRLMDLYYMGVDETTDYFGPQTSQAIRYFQRKHGLTVDGAAGPETQALLFSDQAKEYTMALGICRKDCRSLVIR